MVQIINVIDSIPDKIYNEFYLNSIMPISIEKLDNNIFYAQFMCDVITVNSKQIIYLLLGFTSDDESKLKTNELYVSNIKIDKARNNVYEKVISGMNNTNVYQVDFNIKKNLNNGFFEIGLSNGTSKNFSKLYINKNMFLRISLFIDCLIRIKDTIMTLFSDAGYEFMEEEKFTGNNYPNLKKSKMIVHDNILYCIYKTNEMHYMEIPFDKFKKDKVGDS